MQRRRVDLPPPEGPSSTKVCRGKTSKSMPFRTSSLPNDFHTCSAFTMGVPLEDTWIDPRFSLEAFHGPLLGCGRFLVAEASAEVRL